MNDIIIRRIGQYEIKPLQEIGRKTFHETFSDTNTDEDMQKYLEESFAEEKLINELKNQESEFYFAVANQTVIGYLKINTGQAQTELKEGNGLEVERIYVLKDYHGKRVGQLLFDKAIEIAKQMKVDYIWLGVWENNTRALNFYKKNGFVEFGKHIFRLGEDEQTDIMMRKDFFLCADTINA